MHASEAGRFTWRRSTQCASSTCVEVRRSGAAIDVRDSKQAAGPVLSYTPEEFRAFVLGAKAGEFDDLCELV